MEKIAKKMLMKTESIEEIHEITELPMKEIQRLKDEIEK
ncbi:inorganic polyphosphate kinase [Candidatus Rickettsia kedanie]